MDEVKVIIDNHVRGMSRMQSQVVLNAAKKYVPVGIYAIEKDGIIELRKDKCNIVALDKLKTEFEQAGYIVYANGF